ncbi:MAG: glycosyltransferase family 2 protein [Bacillota bacterium]
MEDKRYEPCEAKEFPTISIIVPMYNEAENIGPFYERLRKVLDEIGEPYEIICVNDGSTDATLEKLLKLREKDQNVKVIDFSRNFGKEIALTAGLDFSSGMAIIPIDADLQDPPELIPHLVAKWKEGYEVVYATRKSRHGESWFKKLAAHAFYRLAEKIMDINIPRDTGDFRLMDRSVVEALKALRERNRFMKGLFAWVGFKQAAVHYEREPRHKGKTKWNYFKLCNLAIEGITSFSYVPLRLATYVGLVVALLAFLYAAYIVMVTLIYGNPVPGWPSLVTIVLFLGGVQLICTGILGEYIGRIYNEVKQRPVYMVRQKWGL